MSSAPPSSSGHNTHKQTLTKNQKKKQKKKLKKKLKQVANQSQAEEAEENSRDHDHETDEKEGVVENHQDTSDVAKGLPPELRVGIC